MFVRKAMWVSLVVIFVTGNLARAQRTCTYTETVGEGYEHETIQAAIDAMNEHALGPDALGCIEVYPGTYEHHAGSRPGTSSPDETKWLPQYCDLIGMGQAREDVEIEMDSDCTGPLHDNHYIIIGAGDNHVYHLKLYPDPGLGARNGICLQQDSVLNDCIVETCHKSVYGREENLVVTNCEIKSKFGPCITADKTFTISDCDLYPRARSWGMEYPAGIRVGGSGEIRRVGITASCESSCPNDGCGLYGIQLELAADEEVLISDVTIDLDLTSLYKLYTFEYDRNLPPEGPHTLHVCGILSGKRKYQLASVPDNSYPGRAVVRDCMIDVTGIEVDGEGEEDGADIMVDGVCIRGGGTVHVYGCSSITTSRDEAGAEDEGYEYLLNEENGTLGVSFPSIQLDPPGDEYYNPSKADIDPLWAIGFLVEHASGDAMAVFDYCGNLLLYGSLTDEQTWPSATTDDEFIVQNSAGNNLAVINAVDGDMFIHGLVKLDSDNDWVDPDTGENEFIIRDKDGYPVAYIDESGNVYLKGGVFEEFELIEW